MTTDDTTNTDPHPVASERARADDLGLVVAFIGTAVCMAICLVGIVVAVVMSLFS